MVWSQQNLENNLRVHPVSLSVFFSDDKRCYSSESYNFEAVHNINEYRCETVSTMREALKTWNMTVQGGTSTEKNLAWVLAWDSLLWENWEKWMVDYLVAEDCLLTSI